MKTLSSCLILFSLLIGACNPTVPNGFIQTDDTRFIDPGKREVIFHGANLVNKDPRKNYLEVYQQSDFEALAEAGFNVVRLGIIWSGIEPEPGLYDEAYLQKVDTLIMWAKNTGLYVLLDMHQDLFGQKYSDGAPDWATLDLDLPHYKGAIWSDSYLISPAVQAAFDNFWDNAHASDGVGVMDHYALMWQMLAERYKGEQAIIGYDLMNEPFLGSEAQKIMPLMIQAYANEFVDLETAFAQGRAEEELAGIGEMWADEQGRLEILRTLEDPEIYRRVIGAAAGICQQFDREILNPFYQKLRDSIRVVDENHILFLEHNYFANTGIESMIEVPLNEAGEPDPQIAYAAHGYDLVTDTRDVGSPANTRVDLIFRGIYKKSKELNVPLFIGEWGAYGGDHPIYRETSGFIMGLFEEFACSDTYWAYQPGIAAKQYYPVLQKAFPRAIAGKLNSYVYNPEEGSFLVSWTTTGLEKFETEIYYPSAEGFDESKVTLEPVGSFHVQKHENSNGLIICIAPNRFAGVRKISYY